jgi:hypothetical protein
MAVTALSGVSGSVTGPTFAANIHKWECATENDVHEYSVFGEFDNSGVSGLRRHTGTMEFVCVDAIDDMEGIEPAAAGFATTIALELLFIDSATDKKIAFASVFLDNVTITQDVEGVARGTATFVANGGHVYTDTSV